MVYVIESKTVVKGQLLVMRSLHVGGFGTSTNVDLPLALNGQGKVYIPGTSLAGALRSWMSQLCDPTVIKDLWGFQANKGDVQKTPEQKGHASRIVIEDAVVTLPNGEPMTHRDTELRSGVGIDRIRGAAADRYFYNRGVIPRGATLDFHLSIEVPKGKDTNAFHNSIDQLLLALTSENIRLGAAKSRGLGRVKLIGYQPKGDTTNSQTLSTSSYTLPTAKTFALSTRDGLLSFLKHRTDTETALPEWTKPAATLALPRLTATLHWQPVGPLMVKSELTGELIDILPLMGSVDGENQAFLLPGSSIKGALRTQAERIVRTVLQIPIGENSEAVPQLKEQICLPLIDTLFGFTADSNSDSGDKQQRAWAKGLGALIIEDCFSKPIHPLDTLQRLSQIPKDDPDELETVLQETALIGETQETQVAYHVAIDRWTGGAAKNFLYTNLEPFSVHWEPIELAIDFNRFPANGSADETTFQLAGVALLMLLLRDLGDRRIPLGYGTNRGLGTLRLSKVAFETEGLVPEALSALTAQPWIAQADKPLSFDTIAPDTINQLNTAWSAWIAQPSMADTISIQEVEST